MKTIKSECNFLFGKISPKIYCIANVVDDDKSIKNGDIVAYDYWGNGDGYKLYSACVGAISGIHVYGVYNNPMFGKFLKVLSTDNYKINEYINKKK